MKFVVLLTVLSLSAIAEVPRSMFDSGKHCVAYKAKRKTLSFINGSVVGKNCDISVQLLPVVGGGYQIEVNVPISGFDSGDRDQDQEVKDMLKESEQADIVFRSKVMTEKQWHEVLQKPAVVFEGELTIAGKSYSITAPANLSKEKDGIEFDGVAVVPFAKFDLQPPKRGGGFIAKTDSDVELHFHLTTDKILGADKILAPPAKETPVELVTDLEIPEEKDKKKAEPVLEEKEKQKERP
jgi:hypothetical protein